MKTAPAKIQPNPSFPVLINKKTARLKNPNSRKSRRAPGIGIGAFPEWLESSGTLKVPQIAAAIKGNPSAKRYLSAPGDACQPQLP